MTLREVTLFDVLERNAKLHGEQVALISHGERISHRSHLVRVRQLAAGLAAAGVAHGDRVAMLGSNCREFVELYGAAARLGAIVVAVNWRLSADEIAYVLADTTPRAVMASIEHVAKLPKPDGSGVRCHVIGGEAAGFKPADVLYDDDGDALLPRAVVRADDGIAIMHTAAVGGRPRGALISHAGLLAVSLQLLGTWGLTRTDINLAALPLFHVMGLTMLVAAQQAGAANVLVPRFDVDAVLGHIEGGQGSLLGVFPPMLGSLLDAAQAQRRDLSGLRVVTGLDSPETIARLESTGPNATFWLTYGQSETSGSVTMSPNRERAGSAGRPMPMSVLAVVDDAGVELPAGQQGDVVVRGPAVFRGYWNLPDETAHVFRNGWLHTGDLGRLDPDGYLWYAGRSPEKELIKPGGENVYPAEVERVLHLHPDVVGAVVFGVPDADWSEAVKAVCVLREGSDLTAVSLIDFVGERIARYKRPKHVVFVRELPRRDAGGVDRDAVKRQYRDA